MAWILIGGNLKYLRTYFIELTVAYWKELENKKILFKVADNI